MENSNKKEDGAETDKPAVSPETVLAPVGVGASVAESTPASADVAIDRVAPADVKIAEDDKAEITPREAVQAGGVEEADGAVRAALKELLDKFGIESAVIIDDEAYDVALSDVIAIVEVHKEAAIDPLGAIGAQLNFEVEELWRGDITREWDRLQPVDRVAMYGRLARLDGDAARTHARFAASVRQLLPIECAVLQPDEWVKREDEFVKNRIAQRPDGKGDRCKTLLLFDLDLHKAGMGDNGGATLVLGLIAKYPRVDVLCGIISSQVRPDDEGAALANAPAGFEHERVVRIAKGDLPEQGWQFVYGVKRALLAPHLVEMRQTAEQIIAEAHEAATKWLKGIEVYDLVYAVITRSDEEGVRDFETLFRVHNVAYQDELRRRAHANSSLNTAAAELRVVSALATKASKPTDRKTWEIQRREMYENERDLSSLHLPLELGDIFACENREGQPTEFILLGQPCDLMVRTRDGRRRIEQALVAQISRVTPDKQDGESLASFRLPYYVEGGGHAWVKFPKHFTVPLWVLDLCVFTDNARAIFQAAAAPPPGLSDAWMKRRALVAKDAERFVTRALPRPAQQAGKKQEVAQPAQVALMERVLAAPFVVARAQLAPVSLEVGCQRIQRLLRPYAADMLTKFGHYLSRTAFEVDLGEGTLE